MKQIHLNAMHNTSRFLITMILKLWLYCLYRFKENDSVTRSPWGNWGVNEFWNVYFKWSEKLYHLENLREKNAEKTSSQRHSGRRHKSKSGAVDLERDPLKLLIRLLGRSFNVKTFTLQCITDRWHQNKQVSKQHRYLLVCRSGKRPSVLQGPTCSHINVGAAKPVKMEQEHRKKGVTNMNQQSSSAPNTLATGKKITAQSNWILDWRVLFWL